GPVVTLSRSVIVPFLQFSPRRDLRGACDELPRWRFAGGKGVRGLLIRRNKARQLCHEGLDGVPADVPFRWDGA
ncbi:peptidase M3, partial [Rhodovulum sulfidophilum]|nr:peptidase M3 [Rhodovulum sulfidophilum]